MVVVESDEKNDDIARCRELQAFMVIGAANEEWALRRACVDRAQTLISVTGNDQTNVETALLAHRLNDQSERSHLRCIIHMTDPHLQAVLRELHVDARRDDPFGIEFFNAYEIGARIMLRDPPLGALSVPAAHAPPHLVIAGLGQLGQTLLWRAARDWRIDRPEASSRLLVTIVDTQADQRIQDMLSRYPRLIEVAELHSVPLDIYSHAFTVGEFLHGQQRSDDAAHPGMASCVYVCLKDDSLATYAALNLFRHLRRSPVPVVVSMTERGVLSTLLDAIRQPDDLCTLRVVGLLDIACSWDLVSGGSREVLAQALHQGYLAQQLVDVQQPVTSRTLVGWDQLSEELKSSNRRQVDHLCTRLKACGFELVPCPDGEIELLVLSPDDADRLARMEHERWLNERMNAGWTHGAVKDLTRRISPFLVTWDELSDDEREYNRMIAHRLPAVLAKADYALVKQAEQSRV